MVPRTFYKAAVLKGLGPETLLRAFVAKQNAWARAAPGRKKKGGDKSRWGLEALASNYLKCA